MRNNSYIRVFGFTLAGFFLWTCASQAPPPGGPKDEEPPTVVYTKPEPGSTNIDPKTEIVIEFSEYLNRRSVKPSIFISPFIEEGFEVDVSRRTITITFKEPLTDSTTYIVTLRTAITDLRGNKLAQSFQLAFSTGNRIDQGRIAGRVYRRDLPKGDVSIIAYRKDDVTLDSLLSRRPDYIANPNEQGRFAFANMRLGDYLIMALQDKNSNYYYDPGEWTGIPPDTFWAVRDTMLTEALQMQMFQYPADSLVLTKVEQTNHHQMTIGFNRPLKSPPSLNNFQFIGEDTLSPVSLARGEAKGEFFIEHYKTTPDSMYLFLVKDLLGAFGLPFGKERNRRDITISTEPDTLPLQAPGFSIEDSTTNVSQKTGFVVRFPRAVQQLSPDSLLRISGVDSTLFDIAWEDGQTLVAQPDSLWPAETWVNWTFVDSLVRDFRDSTYSDTVTNGSFRIEPGTEYGIISGTVDAPEKWVDKLRKVQALNTEKDVQFRTHINPNGRFQLRRLPAGEYRLESYYDQDSSESYSFGRPTPFVPSEYFVIFPDTVSVRARWESSGYNLRYPAIK